MYRLILLTVLLSTSLSFATENRFVCLVEKDHKQYTLELPFEQTKHLMGQWTNLKTLQEAMTIKQVHKDIKKNKDIFLLLSPRDDLLRLCYSAISLDFSYNQLYFAQLKTIKAFRGQDKKCSGHSIVYQPLTKVLAPVYLDRKPVLRQKLKDYKFDVVLPELIYRSQKLGQKGIQRVLQVLNKQALAPLQSIASIHVMGFGGAGGDFNIQELAEAQKRNITFLHSYHYDPKLTVYMDGTDPSKIVPHDLHRGNIYDPKTVERFIPDPKIRSLLQVDKSLLEKRVLMGNTSDFLQSIENLIDAPWPLLIHCNGGRHKTGMFSIVFEYLAFNIAMDPALTSPIWIPAYQNRMALWLQKKASFSDIFTGGALLEKHHLRPAEMHYAQHNKSVFRKDNIEFMRGLVGGQLLDTPDLQAQWQKIQEKFATKFKTLAPYYFEH